MAGGDGLLSAGDKLVEAGLATGQDRAPPGAGAPALLLALREQTEVSQASQPCNVLTSHSDIFNKSRVRNSSHERDIFQVS